MSTTTAQSPNLLMTHCKDCTFARFFQDEQTGCNIRDMKGNFHVEYDGTFYNRVFHDQCQFYRAAQDYYQIDLEERIEKVYKEVEIKYHLVVKSGAGLDDTLRSVFGNCHHGNEIVPQRVVVVEHGDPEPTLKIIKQSNLPCIWTLEEFFEERDDWRDDVLVKFKDGAQMFAFIEAGTKLPQNFFRRLNNKIHREDFRFGILRSPELFLITYGVYFLGLTCPLRYMEEALEKTELKPIWVENLCEF